jgi:ABC-type phosphate transport system substrate-binding protein
MKRRQIINRVLLVLFACAGSLASQPSSDPAAESPDAATKTEPLAIVVHKSNPVETLTSEELRKLCLAERRHWPDGRKVTIVLREPGQPEREAVLRQLCRMNEDDFTRHHLQSAFTGQTMTGPKELATAAGVRRFVFNVPGAIGFVRARDVDDTVKVVRLDGRALADPAYSLKVSLTPPPDRTPNR